MPVGGPSLVATHCRGYSVACLQLGVLLGAQLVDARFEILHCLLHLHPDSLLFVNLNGHSDPIPSANATSSSPTDASGWARLGVGPALVLPCVARRLQTAYAAPRHAKRNRYTALAGKVGSGRVPLFHSARWATRDRGWVWYPYYLPAYLP